jgi:hypothetical protein
LDFLAFLFEIFVFEVLFDRDFLAFLTAFFVTFFPVFFGALAALRADATAFLTGAGVFLATVLRTRLATDRTAPSASAPATVATMSVTASPTGLISLRGCSLSYLVSSMEPSDALRMIVDSVRQKPAWGL